MSTGDNVFTAASVAKECHIVPDDQIIYHINVTPISGSQIYELTCNELIVDIIEDDEDEEEEEETENEFTNVRRLTHRDISKVEVESVSEDEGKSLAEQYGIDFIEIMQ